MDFIQIIKHSLELINNNINNQKNNFLDPFSVITYLGLLSQYPYGTKISVNNNKLQIQQKDYFQGLYRFYNGDKQTDINILLTPILYAVNYYIINKNNDLKIFFELAQQGLFNLRKTYTKKDISYSIDILISIIQNCINDNQLNIESYKLDKIKIQIYDKFTQLWIDKYFDIVCKLLNDLNNKRNNDKQNLLLSIEQYIKNIENECIDILDNIIN